MTKKFIIICSIICLVCILMLATLSACNNDVVYEATSFVTSDYDIMDSTQLAKRIDSSEQLATFCNDAKMPINDKDGWHYDSDLFAKLRSYNKSFFKNKSLIIVFRGYGHPQNIELVNMEKQGDTLNVNIHNVRGMSGGDASFPTVEGHFFLIEVKKSSIRGVKQIEVKEKLVFKTNKD